MAFQVKDFISILAGMVNHVRGVTTRITDFTVGSVARTLLEAPAQEIEELYIQFVNGVREAIPVAIYSGFDFSRLPAVAAYGYLRFTTATAATSDIPIPAGTEVRTAQGTAYKTLALATLDAGETTVDVMAQCTIAGAAGNVGPLELTEMPSPISGISVTNPSTISTGRDIETDDERKERFREFIRALPRGTIDAVSYGARTVALYSDSGIELERVASVSIIEPFMTDPEEPVGIYMVVVDNGTNGECSLELVVEAQRVVNGYTDAGGNRVLGWKAAGTIAQVMAATIMSVDWISTLILEDGYALSDVDYLVEAAQRDYVSALGVGEDVIVSELVALALGIDGVYDATINIANVSIAETAIAVPGTVSVVSA